MHLNTKNKFTNKMKGCRIAPIHGVLPIKVCKHPEMFLAGLWGRIPWRGAMC
jgi:hypothetical protein